MFNNNTQRTFDYMTHKGASFGINGNLRKKNPCISSLVQSASKPQKQKLSFDAKFTMLRTNQLQEKASRISFAHKQNSYFIQGASKTEIKPHKKTQQDNQRKSGIQYLIDKSPCQTIKQRSFVPSSKWFDNLPKPVDRRSKRSLRQSIYSNNQNKLGRVTRPTTDIFLKQSKVQTTNRSGVQLAHNRKQENLDSNILLG